MELIHYEPQEEESPNYMFLAELFRGALQSARRYVRHNIDCAVNAPWGSTPDRVNDCTCGLKNITPAFDRAEMGKEDS